MKRYKSTKILGGGPPGKIVQCQSFDLKMNPDLWRIFLVLIIKLAKKIKSVYTTFKLKTKNFIQQ